VAETVAAFDCGSNSTRLLIVDATNTTLVRETNITRLSQGVDASGSLLSDAMERTFEVLGRYRAECEDAGVTKGLLVATSAVRDAHNGAEFSNGLRRLWDSTRRFSKATRRPLFPTSGRRPTWRRSPCRRWWSTWVGDRPSWR